MRAGLRTDGSLRSAGSETDPHRAETGFLFPADFRSSGATAGLHGDLSPARRSRCGHRHPDLASVLFANRREELPPAPDGGGDRPAGISYGGAAGIFRNVFAVVAAYGGVEQHGHARYVFARAVTARTSR